MAKLRLAYGRRKDIPIAINKGQIPPGTTIYTSDTKEILFYDNQGVLETYQERYKFGSVEEAETWVRQYDCQGEILSIHEGNRCGIYVVGYDNKLTRFEDAATILAKAQSDWNITDPNDPAYIKNKPTIKPGIDDKSYVHDQMSASKEWVITHNLGKYPSVTIVDSAGNVVIGDINYISNTQVLASFTSMFSGKAYLN